MHSIYTSSESEATDGHGIETGFDIKQQYQMSSEVNINNVNMVITTQDDINREIIMTTPLGIENTENAQVYDPAVIDIESTEIDYENQTETRWVQNGDQNKETSMDINSIIKEISDYYQDNKVSTTKEIVCRMQSKFVRGRSLDTCPEGATNYISVDRYNILQTGMEEVAGLHDLFLTLDVQFYGEVACGADTHFRPRGKFP